MFNKLRANLSKVGQTRSETFTTSPQEEFIPSGVENVINNTNKTRISFNCRYKNIFSPYSESEENEKKIGSFYEPINLKVASIIGFEHEFGK